MVLAENSLKGLIMKVIPIAILAGAILAAPLASLAQQSNVSMTRAQVRTDLIKVEKAGYNPAKRDEARYPADIQSAESRVAANDQSTHSGSTAVGGSSDHTSSSGQRLSTSHGRDPLYRHH